MPKPTQFRGRMTGKVAIVTGAGSQSKVAGIGQAIASVLAGEGARVCLVDRELDRARTTLDSITAAGGEGFAIAADVTSAADCERVARETTARYGGIDILVNNVGISVGARRLEDFDEAIWDKVMATNVKSAILMAKSVMPSMLSRGGGAIVNVSSIASLRAYGTLAYGPSKAALNELTTELALVYGPRGIRVNAVAPGHMATPMVLHMMDAPMLELRRKASPLGIEGDAWDIALAVLFLASEDARFITGVLLPVEGGVIGVGSLAAHEMLKAAAPL